MNNDIFRFEIEKTKITIKSNLILDVDTFLSDLLIYLIFFLTLN